MNDFEIIERTLKADRSVRRFNASREITRETLIKLVSLTRYCSSGRNLQPLRYRIVNNPDDREKVYPLLKWAGYLTDWDGPAPEERPAAYLVQCIDTRLGKECLCDDGLHLQAVTLGARAIGIGACIIKAFNAPALKQTLNIPDFYEPRYVLALGYPVEEVVIEDMSGALDADYKYYRTADGVHHVPKRPIDELLIV